MTCRHKDFDKTCTSFETRAINAKRTFEGYKEIGAYGEIVNNTPDSEHYRIVGAGRIGPHLVLKVLYPNCVNCSFEGEKVMVFLNVDETQALMWKKIDPHFREGAPNDLTEAPSPSARFPATPDGWKEAIEYARRKA